MIRRRALFVIASAISAAACLFPSLGGLAGGANEVDAADAFAQDVAIDYADAGANDGAPSPISIDDFELGCDPYSGGFAMIKTGDVAHSGQHSCHVCCNGGPYCTLDRGFNAVVQNPPIGATYSIEAWMQEDTTTSGLLGVTILRLIDPTMSTFLEQSVFTEVPINETSWTRVTNTLTVMEAGAGIALYVAVDSFDPGDCFFVDDIAVYLVDGG